MQNLDAITELSLRISVSMGHAIQAAGRIHIDDFRLACILTMGMPPEVCDSVIVILAETDLVRVVGEHVVWVGPSRDPGPLNATT